MKRWYAPLALLIALTFLVGVTDVASPLPHSVLAATQEAACAPNSGSGSISGLVTSSTGTPLPNAYVTAYTLYGYQAGVTVSDNAGNYKISKLIAGEYLLEFKPLGGDDQTEWYSNQPTPATAVPVTVGLGRNVTGINAQLDPGAHISGLVTGDGGAPVPNMFVSVLDSTGNSIASAYTDANGLYATKPGIKSGSYRLRFQETHGYPRQYYNGALTLETATTIDVTSPNTVNVNTSLLSGATITGHVIDVVSGLPIKDASVGASGQASAFGFTDANGAYALTGLLSGTYQLKAFPPNGGTTNLFSLPQTVVVTAPETLSDIDIGMKPGSTVVGLITSENGTPLPNISVRMATRNNGYQTSGYTDATGTYTITALPSGSYYASFQSSTTIFEFYNNKTEFREATFISVTGQVTTTHADTVLRQGGFISGTVVDAADGMPIEGVFVEVLDARGGRLESAFTGSDGTYQTYHTLPSGNYRVRFNADSRNPSCAYVTAYYNSKPTMSQSDLVTVTAPNATEHIDATLARGSIIFGKVTDTLTGEAIKQTLVQVSSEDGTPMVIGRPTFLGGYHTDTALPSGKYRVSFTDNNGEYIDEFFNNQQSQGSADLVTLNAPSDLMGIDAELDKGGRISGRITAADTGLPLTDGSIAIYDSSGKQVEFTNIQPDGSYLSPGGLANGFYRVAVFLRPRSQVSAQASLTADRIAPVFEYMPTFYPSRATFSSATPVLVSIQATTPGINIAAKHGVFIPFNRR